MVLDALVSWIVDTIGVLGYFGIFVLMALESSFFPFPSEVAILPAGYLAFLGEMNLGLVILAGVLGSLAGAWVNYLIARRYGRRFLLRFMSQGGLERVEVFFEKHGHISTFNGRLLPFVRQYISFPAGLAKMNGWKFSLYTALGSGIWVSILAFLGYFLGENEELVITYLKEITLVVLGLVLVFTLAYVWFARKRRN